MAERTEDSDFFQDLHRFAFVLTRNADTARRIVTESLDEALQRHRGHLEHERWVVLCFQGVRKRALANVTTPKPALRNVPDELPPDADRVLADADPDLVLAALHNLPEPGRSALVVLLLKVLDAEAMEKMLGVGLGELSDAVHAARLSLIEACRVVRPVS